MGCRILKVFSNICPQSSDRVVQCIGKANECMDAISDILVLIKEVPIKGSIQNYDPINFDDYLADKYGGFGGDGGNSNRNNYNNREGGNGQGRDNIYIVYTIFMCTVEVDHQVDGTINSMAMMERSQVQFLLKQKHQYLKHHTQCAIENRSFIQNIRS